MLPKNRSIRSFEGQFSRADWQTEMASESFPRLHFNEESCKYDGKKHTLDLIDFSKDLEAFEMSPLH